MNLIEYFNKSAFYIGAALVSLFCIVFTLLQRRTGKPNNRIFLIGICSLLATAVCDLVYCYYQMPETLPEAHMGLYVSNYLYFVLHNMLGMLLFFYALFVTHNFERTPWSLLYLSLVPFAVSELLMLINPLTGWSYHFDADGTFVRDFGEYSVYLSGALYLILSLWIFLKRFSGITMRTRRILLFSYATTVLSIAIQLLYPVAQVELFGEALSFMGLMIVVEYEDEWMDAVTGVCNRNALLRDMKNQLEQGRPFSVICIRLLNSDTVRRTLNISENEIAEAFSEYLKLKHPYHRIYKVSGDSYVLVMMRKDDRYYRQLLSELTMEIGNGFKKNDEWIPLRCLILAADSPERIRSLEELMVLCEGELWNENRTEGLVSENELTRILTQAKMEKLLNRSISDRSLALYYQPVFDAETLTVDSAEALIRYEDFGTDVFLPRDFIKVAERSGSILELGDYILNEVCRFLQSGIPQRAGIRYININLSMVQCMSPDFERRVSAILGRYPGVAPSMINFEIMDTVTAKDYGAVTSVIGRLKAAGFLFSMEGYGSGYSSINSIFALDFDMIKIDKNLLWEAANSREGRILLENSIKTVHNMGRMVTMVGIENAEQMNMMKNLSVDRLQGFYLSEPMTAAEIGERYL